jgi:hypothetical protein
MNENRSTSSSSMVYRFCACCVLTRLLQPVKAHLYSQGIKLSRYVNDRRIAAASEKETVEQLGQALEVIQNGG